MGLTFVMLALLLGCYVFCAVLILFAEHVIRPRKTEPVDASDLPPTDALRQTGPQ
jgi:hypothetical protein